MNILDESAVRQLYIKKKLRRIPAGQYDYITPQARAYLREKKIALVQEEPHTNTDIHPYQQAETSTDIAPAEQKPAHMTHLYGNQLVVKNHPRIVLRGRLDSLQAKLILCQIQAADTELCAELDEVLTYIREILRAEVTGKPMEPHPLLGCTAEQLHEMSHDPKRAFGIGHVSASRSMGLAAAYLNALRADSREAELAAIDAFYHNGEVERTDILTALNRLSSVFYVLECRAVATKKT